jgi:hypothetical protein
MQTSQRKDGLMTAIWTPPRTWTVGELVTAGLLNTHLRDNFEFLKGQIDLPLNFATASSASAYSSGGTAYSDVDPVALKLTLTTSGGAILLGLSSHIKHNTLLGETRLDWNVDGVRLGEATYGTCFMQASAADAYTPISHVLVHALAAGIHTIKLQFASSGGTATIGGIAGGTTLWALELV